MDKENKIILADILLCGAVFGITFNCNDRYAYATADSGTIDEDDFGFMIDLCRRFGIDGVYALLDYRSGREPFDEWKTPTYIKALLEVVIKQFDEYPE